MVSHIWSHVFLFNFDQISQNVFLFLLLTFCFYYWLRGKYRLGTLGKMEDLCYAIFILTLLVPLFRPSVFTVVFFFYIPIYWGYYALPWHDFKADIQEEKSIFKMAKSITRCNNFNGKWKWKIYNSFLMMFWSLSWDHFQSIKTRICFIYNVS